MQNYQISPRVTRDLDQISTSTRGFGNLTFEDGFTFGAGGLVIPDIYLQDLKASTTLTSDKVILRRTTTDGEERQKMLTCLFAVDTFPRFFGHLCEVPLLSAGNLLVLVIVDRFALCGTVDLRGYSCLIKFSIQSPPNPHVACHGHVEEALGLKKAPINGELASAPSDEANDSEPKPGPTHDPTLCASSALNACLWIFEKAGFANHAEIPESEDRKGIKRYHPIEHLRSPGQLPVNSRSMPVYLRLNPGRHPDYDQMTSGPFISVLFQLNVPVFSETLRPLSDFIQPFGR
ncbi:hypothetical protein K438DRAFT_1753567 [Mycena galopus ATCC 62051]|nr:hypothetical protein K438DRAFT_1753567 [Mycena galopus ATCC 62051]